MSQKKVLARLSRIEGQFRGVRKMIENERDCSEIITQISAVREAVAKLGVEVLRGQICQLDPQKCLEEKYLEKIFKFK